MSGRKPYCNTDVSYLTEIKEGCTTKQDYVIEAFIH